MQRIELEKLNDAFETAGVTSIEDLHNLSNEYINKLDMNEVERMNLEQGIRDLSEDFKEDYQAFRVVISCTSDEQKRLLEVGWSGAVIGNMQYADLFLSQEQAQGGYSSSKQNQIEICIKFEYG